MNSYAQLILQLATLEEYEELKRNVFRPGSLSLSESVFWLDYIKNELAMSGADFDTNTALAEFCKDEDKAGIIGQTFAKYRIPVTEGTVGETLRAMELFQELELLSDDVCAHFIREGIAPTLSNLHTLRGVTDCMPGAEDKKESVNLPLAWKFTEGREVTAEEILKEAGLENAESGEILLNWLKERGIYVSAQNVNQLQKLWSLQLPFEPEDAADFAAVHLRKGVTPKDGLLTEYLKNQDNFPIKEKPMGSTPDAIADVEKFLHSMEMKLEELYIRMYSKDAWAGYCFDEYLEHLSYCEEMEEYLTKYDLSFTADHLYAMDELVNKDGVLPYLIRILGAEGVLKAYGELSFFAPTSRTGRVLRKLGESYIKEEDSLSAGEDGIKKLQDYISAWKIMMLLREMEERGFYEYPIKMEKKILRVRIRKEPDGGYTAVMEDASIGGLSLRYHEEAGEFVILAVGSREETLLELQKKVEEGNAKEKGTKTRLTLLYSTEYGYGKYFY